MSASDRPRVGPGPAPDRLRHLVLVLGDQLDPDSAAFDGFDPAQDAVLMAEVAEEATYVAQHKQRLVLFFSAMRHFRDALAGTGRPVRYVALDDPDNTGSLSRELGRHAERTRPAGVIVLEPGDHRVGVALQRAARDLPVPIEVRADRHFIDTRAAFADFAGNRRSLLLETYYRHLRRREGVLMDGREPVGGRWNFDAQNRERFASGGPRSVPPVRRFAPDRTTREVMRMVAREFPGSPGRLDGFDYPVTGDQSAAALADFIEHRLPGFGRFQDAMASGHPYLFHSRLSSAMNLHLLGPRAVIDAALAAYAAGHAPLNAVEGFLRQILGWREYVRGVYWQRMPGYAELNTLDADRPMPTFMWSGETEMRCVRESVGQLVEHAYAHHIQRLMVLGLLCLLLGVRPYDVHRWHMSMYIDAIDWVSLPNVIGMSQFADGGIVGTKPYCASGSYVRRMSDYCQGCRYDAGKAVGEDACPLTTLYWDFLMRHRERFAGNPRMALQLRNLERKDAGERRAIRTRAVRLATELTARTGPS